MRQENQLEALKQRIAESARKAGLDGEMGIEKNIKVCPSCYEVDFSHFLYTTQRAPPPIAEWWDAALLPNKNYDDLALGLDKLHIKTPNSPITIYIQHPIPIPAPGEKNKVALKPIKLTTKVRHISCI